MAECCVKLMNVIRLPHPINQVVRTFKSNSLNWHRCGCLFSFSNPDSQLPLFVFLFLCVCVRCVCERVRVDISTINWSTPCCFEHCSCSRALCHPALPCTREVSEMLCAQCLTTLTPLWCVWQALSGKASFRCAWMVRWKRTPFGAGV